MPGDALQSHSLGIKAQSISKYKMWLEVFFKPGQWW